jgi:hypothetical protein
MRPACCRRVRSKLLVEAWGGPLPHRVVGERFEITRSVANWPDASIDTDPAALAPQVYEGRADVSPIPYLSLLSR